MHDTFYIIKLVIVIVGLSGTSVGNICPNNTGKRWVIMPSMDPTQFSYKIQINVEGLNKSLDGYEFYDHENQTVFLSVDQIIGQTQSRKSMTFDYQYNQTFIVDEGTDNCTVQSLDPALPHRATLFGVGVENGPQAVKHAFYWNGTYNTTDEGEEIIDGIRTDHYQTCLTFEDGNLTYLVDVYFSQANWTMPSAQNAPVLLTLNASDNMNNSWYYIFKFSDYHSSMSEREWRPHKPSGMICPGRKDSPEFNYVFEQFKYKCDCEIWNGTQHFIITSSVAYDFAKKLFRIDMSSSVQTRSSVIHDFNQGISYSIDRDNGKCNTSTISPNSPYTDAVPVKGHSGLVQMQDPVRFNNPVNLTFAGIGKFQDVSAQIWIGRDPLVTTDFSGQKFLLHQTQYYTTDLVNGKRRFLGMNEKLVPVANSTNSTTIHSIARIYDFNENVGYDEFDISSCFHYSKRQTVVMKFEIEHKNDITNNLKGFNNAFLNAVSKHANVSQLRIMFSSQFIISSNVNASKENSSVNGIYMYTTILGLPDIKGDSIYITPQTNLTSAVSNLEKSVIGNVFEISFNASGKVITMNAVSDYWYKVEDLINPTPPVNPPSAATGLSIGVVVGIAVAMAAVGFALAFGIQFWRNRRGRVHYAYTGLQS